MAGSTLQAHIRESAGRTGYEWGLVCSEKCKSSTAEQLHSHTMVIAREMAFKLLENRTNEPNRFMQCEPQRSRRGPGPAGLGARLIRRGFIQEEICEEIKRLLIEVVW